MSFTRFAPFVRAATRTAGARWPTHRRRPIMESKNDRNSGHQTVRALLIALAISAVIAIAPRLRSATAATAPTFTQINLVSDVAGTAKVTDPNLVNPWGMALGLNSGIW